MIEAAHEEISYRNDEFIIENNKLELQLSDLQNKYKKTCGTSNFWFMLPIAGWSYLAVQKNKKGKLKEEEINISQEKEQKKKGIK